MDTTQMHGPVSPRLWMPCASSSCCSMSHVLWPSSLCLQWPRTMPHPQTQVIQTHACTCTCARHRDRNITENMFQYPKNQWFNRNIEISIFLIGNSPFWSSNVKYREAQLYERVLAPRFWNKKYREFHISWQKIILVCVRNTKNSIFHEETVVPIVSFLK